MTPLEKEYIEKLKEYIEYLIRYPRLTFKMDKFESEIALLETQFEEEEYKEHNIPPISFGDADISSL